MSTGGSIWWDEIAPAFRIDSKEKRIMATYSIVLAANLPLCWPVAMNSISRYWDPFERLISIEGAIRKPAQYARANTDGAEITTNEPFPSVRLYWTDRTAQNYSEQRQYTVIYERCRHQLRTQSTVTVRKMRLKTPPPLGVEDELTRIDVEDQYHGGPDGLLYTSRELDRIFRTREISHVRLLQCCVKGVGLAIKKRVETQLELFAGQGNNPPLPPPVDLQEDRFLRGTKELTAVEREACITERLN